MSWKEEVEFTKGDKAARVIQKAWKRFLVRIFPFATLLRYNLDIIWFPSLKCILQ